MIDNYLKNRAFPNFDIATIDENAIGKIYDSEKTNFINALGRIKKSGTGAIFKSHF